MTTKKNGPLDPVINKPVGPSPILSIPEFAKLVVKPEADHPTQVAISGFSQTNYGLYASSVEGTAFGAMGKEAAAEFWGKVSIHGAQTTDNDATFGGQMTVKNDLRVKGSLFVSGDIQLGAADYAEDFDLSLASGTTEDAVPGAVMVLDDIGAVRVSSKAYDRRVAGVISGAGNYRPAVILDRNAERDSGRARSPLALMGKVFCMVDADTEPIAVGDLLTTSGTPGHAMKATDPLRAFGAVIGKALQPLAAGRGMVPILVALQ